MTRITQLTTYFTAFVIFIIISTNTHATRSNAIKKVWTFMGQKKYMESMRNMGRVTRKPDLRTNSNTFTHLDTDPHNMDPYNTDLHNMDSDHQNIYSALHRPTQIIIPDNLPNTEALNTSTQPHNPPEDKLQRLLPLLMLTSPLLSSASLIILKYLGY